LIDLLFKIFHLPLTANKDPFSTKVNTTAPAVEDSATQTDTKVLNSRHNLLDNYLAALLVAFNEVKLLEVCNYNYRKYQRQNFLISVSL
jgi:hypothetical protein